MSEAESEKVVSVSARGQATIPKEFREELGIDTPGRVKFVRTEAGDVVVRPIRSITDLRGVIAESGVRRVDTAETWRVAADFKSRHVPALGDAFALGTAAHVDGTLLVGADDDYDDVTDVATDRFRTEPA